MIQPPKDMLKDIYIELLYGDKDYIVDQTTYLNCTISAKQYRVKLDEFTK